jgi:hypothetical protein
MARYRRERTPKERERPVQAQAPRRGLASGFLPALSCGLRRGRATTPMSLCRPSAGSVWRSLRKTARICDGNASYFCHEHDYPYANRGLTQTIFAGPLSKVMLIRNLHWKHAMLKETESLRMILNQQNGLLKPPIKDMEAHNTLLVYITP